MKHSKNNEETIAEVTRRLVDYYRPERVYLFGSVARGDDGPDSDLDFCVVLPDDAEKALCRPGVHRALWGPGTAVDVVPVPFSDFVRRGERVVASLPASVIREGKLLHDAARISPQSLRSQPKAHPIRALAKSIPSQPLLNQQLAKTVG